MNKPRLLLTIMLICMLLSTACTDLPNPPADAHAVPVESRTVQSTLGAYLPETYTPVADTPVTAAAPGSMRYAGVIQDARDSVQKALDNGTTAATVAIMVNDQIVYSDGFSGSDQPIHTSTGFNVGSIGKLFTMVAALQLVQQGKLDLDAPVTDYLPQFRMADARYRLITVRMLLNHSSGLPGTFGYNLFASAPDSQYLAHLLDDLQSATLKAAPGSISEYCNDGWSLAQMVIESASGMSLADYVQERVFAPAGMARSYDSAVPLDDDFARVVLDGKVLPQEVVNALGAGGFTSTAEDLCRFSQALLHDKFFSSDMFRQSTSMQTAPNTVPFGIPYYDFGYGWDFVSMPQFTKYGVQVLGKSGGTAQFTSQLNVLPSEGVAIAVSLCGTGHASTIAYDITIALLENLGYTAMEVKSPEANPATLPADMLRFEGYYSGLYLYHVSFDTSQSTLNQDITVSGNTYTLDPAPYLDDGSFYSSGSHVVLNDQLGKRLMFVQVGDRYDLMGEALDPIDDVDTSAFDGATWIPYNISHSDLSTAVLNTKAFGSLPGYIFAGFGSSMLPYQLRDPLHTQMALAYTEDQLELSIDAEGEQDILAASGYLYQRISDALPLSSNVEIVLDAQGHNVARTIADDGRVTIETNEACRILQYRNDSDWAVVYDSLNQGFSPMLVKRGDVILLVGKPSQAFHLSSE